MGHEAPRAARDRDPQAPSSGGTSLGERGDVAVAGKPMGRDLRTLLERDGILIIDTEPFQLSQGELDLIERYGSDGRSKNSSFNPNTGDIDGVLGGPAVVRGLSSLMARYSAWSRELIAEFFPPYHALLEVGRTSLRRRSVQAEPPLSRRKDDRSLHLDAFTSQPVAGRRILRVFNNFDPSGCEREWAIAEGGFEDFAERFRGRTRRLLPGEAALLEGLSLTKCRRTDYDQIMLGMHDAAKRDRGYQATARRRYVSFPQGSTWLAFTDQTPHAAVSGQYALEQTFYVPVEALADPSRSPLRILERLWGARLA
ncbi:MAG TPA: Kdo hydroxylase family protein [Caulobacteraceae bacterium]|nr:Kdo hydroxylase family protein [Caulobacteraceae bacterium]